jgi:hypothetical protein
LLFIIFTVLPVAGQRSAGGMPIVSGLRGPLPDSLSVLLTPPSIAGISRDDEQSEKEGLPQRVAVGVPVGAGIDSQGHWEATDDGTLIWKLRLVCPGALAMNATFDEFHLPAGARMFLYNDNQDFIIGAFTSGNNSLSGIFSTELIPGDAVTLQMEVMAEQAGEVQLSVSEISYLYRFFPEFLDGSRSSDACEVNINCPEGENWQKQKRGVVKIYVKKAGSYFWCSGSLLNNARQDRTPFLLTANHCASSVTPEDLAQWVFYFNYEAPACENPTANPDAGTMTGGTLLSSSDLTGSDFMLIRLIENVPEEYSPYYLGWSAVDAASLEGVSIHHPSGDIRKISTYTQPTISSQWGSTLNTHWQVTWSQTESGWGVTEGGSSGAPLFNADGQVIGTLTGGLSSCEPGTGGPGSGPDQPDFFGKFSFSWDQNGTTPDRRLVDWLDPDQTGIQNIWGMNSVLTAEFRAENRLILAGNNVTFDDLSSGPPNSWSWEFEGGEPSVFQGQDPPEIFYQDAGQYTVSLIVSDGVLFDTLVKTHYVEVVGNIFPNPTSGRVHFYLGETVPPYYSIEIFNYLGQLVFSHDYSDNISSLATADLSIYSSGLYTVRIQIGQRYLFGKVLLIK